MWYLLGHPLVLVLLVVVFVPCVVFLRPVAPEPGRLLVSGRRVIVLLVELPLSLLLRERPAGRSEVEEGGVVTPVVVLPVSALLSVVTVPPGATVWVHCPRQVSL